MTRPLLVAVTVIVFAACAAPPPREEPEFDVAVPASWEGHDTTTVVADTSRWWTTFADDSLNDLIDEALANNYNIKMAAAAVDAAAALARLAGAELYPHAFLRFDGVRRKQNFVGFPIPGGSGVLTTQTTTLGVSLDVLWEVDLWGRIRAGQSAALGELEASWADLAAVRLSVASQTTKAWFALIESRLQVELAEETVKSFKQSADFVRSRYEQGVRTSLDLRLSLSQLYAAQALYELRLLQLNQTTRQLEILLGRYPAAAIETDHDLPQVVGDVPAGLPSEILLRRPDLLAAERRYAAAEKRVSEARRAFFPRITLTGAGGTLSEQLGDLVKGDFSVWSVAAGIAQPIFQGGRLRANLALSHAEADLVLADYALSLLNAFSEVEVLLYAEQTLARQEAASAQAAEQSLAAQSLAERQYAAGLVQYVTVLETQRRALTARSELITVRRERLDARVNLHVALGGGFDVTEQWQEFLTAQASLESGDTVE